ncbi:MAG: glycosyltransferase family 39 protein [Lachnospiraceae bacterium]|nr:glycosyltransferase family 39 protein [Lachnospiraceae bacterium]
MKGKMTERKIGLIVLIVLILLFAGLYISLIFNRNIWTDEAYTMELVRENHFWGIIQNTANDVHPPLYYLIVKCFVLLFGDTFLVYKAVSIIPMVLTMLLAVSHIRPWWGERAAVLFLIMVNAIPCVLEYVVQMRMYSWALFFVTWAGLSAYGMCMKEDKRIWKCCCIQLTAASLLGCYTHTYAMLSCVCIYMLLCVCVLLQCRKRKNWILLKVSLLSGSTVAVCYLPWLVILLRQTMSRIENYWIEPVTWEVIRKYPDFLFASRLPGSAVLYLVLCGAAVLVCINRCRKKSDGDWEGLTALMMLAVPLLTALIGIVVSVLVTPFFIARYLLPCMGLFALFLALAFQGKHAYVQILIGIFGLFMVLESYQKNIEMEYHSTHTEELLAYMEEHLEPEDLIAYNFEIYGFIYNIYFEDRVTFLNDVDFAGDFSSIWYFDSCVTPWLDAQVLEQNGLEKEFVMTTGIEQNEFQLYQIRHKE